jgi:hypothetical protein
VSSSQDFGVEQFFRADEFRAVDPSPSCVEENLSFMMFLIRGSLAGTWQVQGSLKGTTQQATINFSQMRHSTFD